MLPPPPQLKPVGLIKDFQDSHRYVLSWRSWRDPSQSTSILIYRFETAPGPDPTPPKWYGKLQNLFFSVPHLSTSGNSATLVLRLSRKLTLSCCSPPLGISNECPHLGAPLERTSRKVRLHQIAPTHSLDPSQRDPSRLKTLRSTRQLPLSFARGTTTTSVLMVAILPLPVFVHVSTPLRSARDSCGSSRRASGTTTGDYWGHELFQNVREAA